MAKQNRIFTEAEFKAAERVDRCYIHLMEPRRFVLTVAEQQFLDNLRKIWAIMCEQNTQRDRIRLISEVVDVSERTVGRYMKDAQYLFGEILELDVLFELHLMYDRYMKLYETVAQDGNATPFSNFDNARRALDSAKEILREIELRKPREAKEYQAILFTDDPRFLKSRLDDTAQTIDFEEVAQSPAALLEPAAVGIPAE